MIRKDNIGIIIFIVIIIIGSIILLANNRIKENEKTDENLQNNENISIVQDNEEIVNPYVEEMEDGQVENNSPELKEEKQFKEIEVTNIKFVYNPGNKMTTITADLINKGTQEQLQEIVKLKILGQNGEEIATIEGLIPNIKPGETKKLRSSATANLSNATNFEIIQK